MTGVSITGIIYKYFDDIEETEIRQNIIMYMEKYNIGNKGISTKTKHKLNFKNQIGGEIFNIELKDKKIYYYNINSIEPIEKSKYKMSFVTFDDINECACLTFGNKKSKNNVLRIDTKKILSHDNISCAHQNFTSRKILGCGIKSFDECISCKDDKYMFKTGDILMQIIIELVKNNPEFSHINKIELADSSQKKCYDRGLRLVYLRTMTHGIPYYAKFGFRPALKTDYEKIYYHNKENFKLGKIISNKDLLEIIEDSKINLNTIAYKAYEKYLQKHVLQNENINPVKLIIQTIKIVDNSISKNKNKNIKIINDMEELSGLCEFIYRIYIKLYHFLGYKDYEENLWELNIKK